MSSLVPPGACTSELTKGRTHRQSDAAAEKQKEVAVRHDFYQTQTQVIVTFYAKNVDRERSSVEFGEQRVGWARTAGPTKDAPNLERPPHSSPSPSSSPTANASSTTPRSSSPSVPPSPGTRCTGPRSSWR